MTNHTFIPTVPSRVRDYELEVRGLDRTYIELRARSADGESIGANVTIERPEVGWRGEIEPANVSHSSSGSQDRSVESARVSIALLEIAVQIALELDEGMHDELVAAKTAYDQERAEAQAREEKLREERLAQETEIAEAIDAAGAWGGVVRVASVNGHWMVGTLTEVGSQIVVEPTTKNRRFKMSTREVTSIGHRPAGASDFSRFQPVWSR